VGWGKVSIAGHGRARGAGCAGVAALGASIACPANIPPPASSECEGQQARAQQHETACRQCEETVGYQIMMTHVAPATLEARPNSLKLSESARLKEVVLVEVRPSSENPQMRGQEKYRR
jgi:hypothetical protein